MGPKKSRTSASQAPGVSNPEMAAAGGDPLSNTPTNYICGMVSNCDSPTKGWRYGKTNLAQCSKSGSGKVWGK